MAVFLHLEESCQAFALCVKDRNVRIVVYD